MAKKTKKIVKNGVVIRKRAKTRAVLPYDIAKDTVNRLAPHLSSATQYRRWRIETGSKFLPASPHLVYSNFSWMDFLNTDNLTIGQRIYKSRTKKVREMWAAIKWAQEYCQNNGINTAAAWQEAKRKDSEIPKDIPMHPDNEYSDFPGYKVWIGKTPLAHLEAAQRQTPILVLVHPKGEQNNVLRMLRLPSESELRDMWPKQSDFDRILGCWKWETDLESDYALIMGRFGGTEEQIIVPNVHELTWELNTLLEMVRLR